MLKRIGFLARFQHQGRLSMRAVAEGQAFWRPVQIETEDSPECSASGDKVLAVSGKVKPLSSRLFIR